MPAPSADPVAVAARHESARLVGPCYDTTQLAALLGVHATTVRRRAAGNRVLACRTRHRYWRYPAFQFDEHHRTLAHLEELLAVLTGPDTRRRWRAARWLAAPAPYLPGRWSAATWLRAGRDPRPVLAAARADANRWSD